MKKVVMISVSLCLLIVGIYVIYTRFNKDVEMVYVEAHNLTLDDLKDESGKLFTLGWYNDECYSKELEVYEDKYVLKDKVDDCSNKKNCTPRYTNEVFGKYNYNILNIFYMDAKKLESVKKEYGENIEWRVYDLIAAKTNETYIFNDNSYPLNEFLKSINVNMKECAKIDIQE